MGGRVVLGEFDTVGCVVDELEVVVGLNGVVGSDPVTSATAPQNSRPADA